MNRAIPILLVFFVLSGCRLVEPREGLPARTEAYSEVNNAFPFHARFEHLRQVSVRYGKRFKEVRFTSNTTGESETWLLVQRGTPTPTGFAGAKVVTIPLESYAMGSYRYGGVIAKLELLDNLEAYANWKHASVPALLERLRSGILPVNYTPELLAGREVPVNFLYYTNSDLLSADNRHAQMGIISIPMAEHLEATPLARSEWMKVLALFFNKEREATMLFDEIADHYEQLRALASRARTRPSVAVNLPVRDSWPVFGASNQLATFIADAGGDYVWKDVPTRHSMYRMGVENAFDRSLEAEVWIIGADSAGRPGLDEWIARDPQLSVLRAYRAGRGYVTGRRDDPGRNPYWDYAMIQPDIELADHIRMIHPDLLPEHSLTLYRSLDRPEAAAR